MNRMLLAAGLVASIALGACSTAQQSQANTALTNVGTTLNTVGTVVVDGCKVIQPGLAAVGTVNPTVATAAVANGVFCAANTAVVGATVPASAAPASGVSAASAPAAASTPLAGASLR